MALNDYLAMQNWSQPVNQLMGTAVPVAPLIPPIDLSNSPARAGFFPPEAIANYGRPAFSDVAFSAEKGVPYSGGLGDGASFSLSDLWNQFTNKLGGAVGTKEAPGWGGLALGGAQALGSAYLGMKQYGIAKKTLEEGRRQFDMNYDAQRRTTNSALEDRQRARVASNAGAYQSVGDYMNQNGIR